MKIIVVSGTPGTGKTKVAKALAKLIKADYKDIQSFNKKIFIGYNKELKTKIVDANKFVIEAIKLIRASKRAKRSLVIDSHLSHYIPKKYVDLCIITKCGIRKLKSRLHKRHYIKKKIRENLDAEIMDVCMLEAIANKQKIRVVDTTKTFKTRDLKKLI